MSAIHRITGYGKRTDRIEIEHPIHEGRLSEICALASVPREDEAAVGAYPLDAAAARQVGPRINKPLNVDAYDWFLEPFADH